MFFCGSLRLSFFWTAGGCRVFVDSKKGINRHTHSVRSKITPAGRQICPLQQSEAGKVYVPSILYTLRPHALIRSGQSVLVCFGRSSPTSAKVFDVRRAPRPGTRCSAGCSRPQLTDAGISETTFPAFVYRDGFFLSGRQLFLSGRHFSRFGDSCGLLKIYQADTCFYQADTFPFLVPD